MALYNKVYTEVQGLSREQVIQKFELQKHELWAMKVISSYGGKCEKDKAIALLQTVIFNTLKITVDKNTLSKTFGSLKKKGLIYSVSNMPGWVATDIKL